MFQNTKKKLFWVHTRVSSEVYFRSTESQTFYWLIMTADDSIKCQCANSDMTGQVGGFQNPGVCLQAFPSFFPHPLPALLLAPFFARSSTLVPRSLLLNRTETLATQATGPPYIIRGIGADSLFVSPVTRCLTFSYKNNLHTYGKQMMIPSLDEVEV